jgi:peptide-methionine (S)-S-oxide reductase
MPHSKLQRATFGAGCFLGVEAEFAKMVGVKETTVGYMGGHIRNPTYEDVCGDLTGHAEVVDLKFDPREVNYETLLEKFWAIHDPTQFNRQGPDHGSQYRSVIFYHNSAQKDAAERAKSDLEEAKRYPKPVVTEIAPASSFWRAEEYHQKYFEKNGGPPTCH